MKVDSTCHPRNFFNEVTTIIGFTERSKIPEMQLAARSLRIEVDDLVEFMMKNRIPEE